MKVTLRYLGLRHSTVLKDALNNEIILYKDIFTEVSLNQTQIKEVLSKKELFEVKPFRVVDNKAEPVPERTHNKILQWDGTTFTEI